MPKLIHSISAIILPFALLTTLSDVVAQTCRSESQIPSSTPTTAFTDHGDGTITHRTTGLMWMKCSLGQSGNNCAFATADTYTWANALDAAPTSVFAGYTDWRVPNVNELRSIVEERCYEPSMNTAIFPAISAPGPRPVFWSSSPAGGFSYGAAGGWYVAFDDGLSYSHGLDVTFFVRLVRSAQ